MPGSSIFRAYSYKASSIVTVIRMAGPLTSKQMQFWACASLQTSALPSEVVTPVLL